MTWCENGLRYFPGWLVPSPVLFVRQLAGRYCSCKRINQVRQVCPPLLFPYCHANLLSHASRWQIFWPKDRDQTVHRESCKSEATAGAGGFRCETLSPVIAADVVADFDFVCAIDILNREATVADQFAG